MGRRSINTTKSGKYMNPTDQARKEARKKELKKNKRQRQMVRAAVLKGKDPAQILDEMEKIDEMEYNVLQPSPLNEKVLREKRKKLKETFDRVMRLYHNDDPELWAELKRKEVEYEKKRLKKQHYFESVKSAQSVTIDEIPLPQMQISATPNISGVVNRIPPPSALQIPPFISGPAPQGHISKSIEMGPQLPDKSVEKKSKEPPGCPPGPPPDLSQFPELNSDDEDDFDVDDLNKDPPTKLSSQYADEDLRPTIKDDVPVVDIIKPTSLQQRMLAISGQNIEAFMKEIDNVNSKNKEPESRDSDRESPKSSDNDDEEEEEEDEEEDESVNSDDDDEEEQLSRKIPNKKEPSNLSIPLPPIPPPPPAMGMPGGPPPPPMGMPPAMMFRPPPMRPGGISGLQMRPPGPPPGRPGMQMQHRMGIRMPPGPPPGLPPARLMHHHNQKSHHNNPHHNPAKDSKGITTITAKPQIRNLSADVTRFVPSALRVKRDDHKILKRPRTYHTEMRPSEPKQGATKDDAYLQFMREMQGLL